MKVLIKFAAEVEPELNAPGLISNSAFGMMAEQDVRGETSGSGGSCCAPPVLCQTPSVLLPPREDFTFPFSLDPLSSQWPPLKCIDHNLDQRLVCVHRRALMLRLIRRRVSRVYQVPVWCLPCNFGSAMRLGIFFCRCTLAGEPRRLIARRAITSSILPEKKIIAQSLCVCVRVHSSLYTVVGIDFFHSEIAAKPTLPSTFFISY